MYVWEDTPSEREIAALRAIVKTGGEERAAYELELSIHTIHSHIAYLRNKSRLHTHAQLVDWLASTGRLTCVWQGGG